MKKGYVILKNTSLKFISMRNEKKQRVRRGIVLYEANIYYMKNNFKS